MRVNTDFAIFLVSAVALWAGILIYSASKGVTADLEIVSADSRYQAEFEMPL